MGFFCIILCVNDILFFIFLIWVNIIGFKKYCLSFLMFLYFKFINLYLFFLILVFIFYLLINFIFNGEFLYLFCMDKFFFVFLYFLNVLIIYFEVVIGDWLYNLLYFDIFLIILYRCFFFNNVFMWIKKFLYDIEKLLYCLVSKILEFFFFIFCIILFI